MRDVFRGMLGSFLSQISHQNRVKNHAKRAVFAQFLQIPLVCGLTFVLFRPHANPLSLILEEFGGFRPPASRHLRLLIKSHALPFLSPRVPAPLPEDYLQLPPPMLAQRDQLPLHLGSSEERRG